MSLSSSIITQLLGYLVNFLEFKEISFLFSREYFLYTNIFLMYLMYIPLFYFKKKDINKKYLSNKIKIKKLKTSKENFIFLLKELNDDELVKNTDEIISYSIENNIQHYLLDYIKSKSELFNIESFIFKNKQLLINYFSELKNNQEKINYFFSNDFQEKFNQHINVKDRLDISRSVLIGKNENFIKWYVDNLDENAHKILDLFKEINYTGDGLYLLKESMKDLIKNSNINNDILKDINNNLVYQF